MNIKNAALIQENLEGKVIVITGASSGFGKGLAEKLAGYKVKLCLAARRSGLLDDLARSCCEAGSEAIAVTTDVSCLKDMQQLAQRAIETFGWIDVWVNDAGAGALGVFTDIPIEENLQVIQTDLMGTIIGSHIALNHFLTTKSGNLINVASMLGKIPAPYYAAYCGAKHGVVGFSAALRQELHEQKIDNIHLATVMPMAMDTPFFEHAGNYSGHQAVPVPPLDEAEKVIDAIFDLIVRPRNAEVPVGKASLTNLVMHNVTPALSEKIMGKITHTVQMTNAPEAPIDPAGLSEPSSTGIDVHDPAIKK